VQAMSNILASRWGRRACWLLGMAVTAFLLTPNARTQGPPCIPPNRAVYSYTETGAYIQIGCVNQTSGVFNPSGSGPSTPVGGFTFTPPFAPQSNNQVLASGGQNSVSGVFDGSTVGTSSSTVTSLSLTLKPNTTTDWAFFVSDTDRAIAQTGPPVVSGTGTWTAIGNLANGNFGSTYQQVLSSSNSLTATSTIGTATNWTSALFFLTAQGTPTVVQATSAGGVLGSNNAQVQFGSNTVIGHSILFILQGLPSTSGTIPNIIASDTQGNNFTPIAVVQNPGNRSVIYVWLATNILGATTDTVSARFASGPTVQGAAGIAELSNLITPPAGSVGFRYLQVQDLSQGGFFQTLQSNNTTCPTGATLGNTCLFQMFWPQTWKDTGYLATCTGAGTITGTPTIQGIQSGQTTTQMNVIVVNTTAAASGYSLMNCTAFHP
jgi:hypothetical protein